MGRRLEYNKLATIHQVHSLSTEESHHKVHYKAHDLLPYARVPIRGYHISYGAVAVRRRLAAERMDLPQHGKHVLVLVQRDCNVSL